MIAFLCKIAQSAISGGFAKNGNSQQAHLPLAWVTLMAMCTGVSQRGAKARDNTEGPQRDDNKEICWGYVLFLLQIIEFV